MIYDFIRFGNTTPSYGRSKEEEINVFITSDLESRRKHIYNFALTLYKYHRPPTGAKGIYVFLDLPGTGSKCLDPDIIPTRYLDDVYTWEIDQWYNSNNMDIVQKVYKHPQCIRYRWEDCKRVWAKFDKDIESDRKHFIQYNSYIPWTCFMPQEKKLFYSICYDRLFNRDYYDDITGYLTYDFIGELFIELKTSV